MNSISFCPIKFPIIFAAGKTSYMGFLTGDKKIDDAFNLDVRNVATSRSKMPEIAAMVANRVDRASQLSMTKHSHFPTCPNFKITAEQRTSLHATKEIIWVREFLQLL